MKFRLWQCFYFLNYCEEEFYFLVLSHWEFCSSLVFCLFVLHHFLVLRSVKRPFAGPSSHSHAEPRHMVLWVLLRHHQRIGGLWMWSMQMLKWTVILKIATILAIPTIHNMIHCQAKRVENLNFFNGTQMPFPWNKN